MRLFEEVINVNGVEIVEASNRLYFPIRPICKALGLNFQEQLHKIYKNKALGSSLLGMKAIDTDGELREMLCLPKPLIYVWLFTIDTDGMDYEKKEIMHIYKKEFCKILLECYDIFEEREWPGRIGKSYTR